MPDMIPERWYNVIKWPPLWLSDTSTILKVSAQRFSGLTLARRSNVQPVTSRAAIS